jgi:uncharacterized protein (TIGR02145 family)
MKLQLKGTQKVASIKVEGKNGELLSGAATVTAYTDETKPAITMASGASTSVTLDCGSGVQLNESTATEFIIALPPTVFTKGFAITVADINSGTQVIETSKSNTILRSSLLVMPVVTVEIATTAKEGDYVDEYDINHGHGIEIDGVVWAPVNCGYHATDFKYGKLYQWGRKYGQGYDGGLYDENCTQIASYSDVSSPEKVSGPVSHSEGQSFENATKFYYNTVYPSDWLDPMNDELWNSGTESAPIKTCYDPCPEGWRVPTYAELDALSQNMSLWTTSDNKNGYWLTGATPYASEAKQVFFPAAGFIDWYTGFAYNRGYGCYYWSSLPVYNGSLVLYLHRHTGMSAGERAYAFSIRCVQE